MLKLSNSSCWLYTDAEFVVRPSGLHGEVLVLTRILRRRAMKLPLIITSSPTTQPIVMPAIALLLR